MKKCCHCGADYPDDASVCAIDNTPLDVPGEGRDAGHGAAQRIPGRDLGDVVGGFPGPGEWRPRRKAIAERMEKKPSG